MEVINSIDWSSIVTEVLMFLVTVVVLPKLFQWLKLNNDDKTRQYLTVAIEGAIKAGVSSYARQTATTPAQVLLSVANDHAVRDNITMFATNYLKDNTPGALKRLGINGGLADIIVSRLDDVTEGISHNIANTAKSLESVQKSSVPVEEPSGTSGNLGVPITEAVDGDQKTLPLG